MRIAFCGDARSGKDTCAVILQNLQKGWMRLAFGDFMKEEYYKKYPEKLHEPKDGDHMIAFSQPKVNVYPRIWVDKLESMMHFYLDNKVYENVVITDLRQPHEEKWCRENGFHIVRVHAPLEERHERMRSFGEDVNRKDLPYEVKADYHVFNDGTLEDLERNLKKLLQVLEINDKIKSVNKSYRLTDKEPPMYYAKSSNYFN